MARWIIFDIGKWTEFCTIEKDNSPCDESHDCVDIEGGNYRCDCSNKDEQSGLYIDATEICQ